jgi:protein-L-isoaspartate(D-aspartate) O-methyltransferase
MKDERKPNCPLDLDQVLDVMYRIPRREFVPPDIRDKAHLNVPLPIGYEQTISQPILVAKITQWVEPYSDKRALDIGTGSGFQAALLAELVKEVYSIEIIEPLANSARERLESLGYLNIYVRHGDGYQGWLSKAPFDIIIVSAALDHIPQPLVDQLAVGGSMVLPVGTTEQTLWSIKRDAEGKLTRHNLGGVAFVPMTGEAISE